MKKELRDNWVTALRSGKYEQGQAELKSEDGCYCCLGVLLDVINPNGWTRNKNDCIIHKDNIEDGPWLVVLSDEMRDKVGIDEVHHNKLWRMNDDGKSFKEIANWIEANIIV